MITTRTRKIAAALIALTLVGGIAASLPAEAATTATRYVTVNSDGSVKVTPDAVRLNANVSVVAGSNKEALAKTSTSAAAVRAALTAAGIAKADIATQSISVYPEYNYTQDKGSVLIGYRGSQGFVVTIKNAENAGAVVDAVVAAGGDNLQIQGVTPFVLDSSKATESARANAVKNAKAKAASYAKLLDTKLGRVNYLVENSSPVNYPPVIAMAKASDSEATVVDLGQQDVTVSITIQWALL
ncbi:SIMPL domain-containing protein [Candidatus Planktophila lacus]|uniref:SIMPL domain-containing protein n=1 Tax=Candidatus Planktophila lacus TaxID=1884913 RepID=UPI000BACC77F|nr:SIMPL domain-containing protein [Candidatus Planktophila lacus]ASY25607.1 SIMPL domain-containing protein [Candidatus Planktophila lacus]